MYVLKSVRRSGLARKILVVLEASAARIGYKVMRLETGSRQHPAMALYESFGFERIAPFGEYVNDPTSICYEKAVARHADA
jgi:putative acetyltransferase